MLQKSQRNPELLQASMEALKKVKMLENMEMMLKIKRNNQSDCNPEVVDSALSKIKLQKQKIYDDLITIHDEETHHGFETSRFDSSQKFELPEERSVQLQFTADKVENQDEDNLYSDEKGNLCGSFMANAMNAFQNPLIKPEIEMTPHGKIIEHNKNDFTEEDKESPPKEKDLSPVGKFDLSNQKYTPIDEDSSEENTEPRKFPEFLTQENQGPNTPYKSSDSEEDEVCTPDASSFSVKVSNASSKKSQGKFKSKALQNVYTSEKKNKKPKKVDYSVFAQKGRAQKMPVRRKQEVTSATRKHEILPVKKKQEIQPQQKRQEGSSIPKKFPVKPVVRQTSFQKRNKEAKLPPKSSKITNKAIERQIELVQKNQKESSQRDLEDQPMSDNFLNINIDHGFEEVLSSSGPSEQSHEEEKVEQCQSDLVNIQLNTDFNGNNLEEYDEEEPSEAEPSEREPPHFYQQQDEPTDDPQPDEDDHSGDLKDCTPLSVVNAFFKQMNSQEIK